MSRDSKHRRTRRHTPAGRQIRTIALIAGGLALLFLIGMLWLLNRTEHTGQ